MKHEPERVLRRRSAAVAVAESEIAARARAGHDEWLLDEALGETFPASDPISPADPTQPERH